MESHMGSSIYEINKFLHNLNSDEICIIEINVLTDSMKPLINASEKHSFQLVRRKPKIGDIALFNIEDKLYCHRVIAEISEYYITKGDNCLFPDKVTIDEKNIMGFFVLNTTKKKIVNAVQLLKMYVYNNFPIFIFYNYQKKQGVYFKYVLSRVCMFLYK